MVGKNHNLTSGDFVNEPLFDANEKLSSARKGFLSMKTNLRPCGQTIIASHAPISHGRRWSLTIRYFSPHHRPATIRSARFSHAHQIS
jgi:hypothetical protein